MTKDLVLVVSYEGDGSAELVMQRFAEIGQSSHLLDLSAFPSQACGSISYADGVDVHFQHAERVFSTDNVKSVWWRRPKGKVRPPLDDPIQKYIEVEAEVFVSSLFALLGGSVLWVSDPEKTKTANLKPLQLKLARRIGFIVPKTVITNDPVVVREFLHSNAGLPLIMKPVGTSYVRLASAESLEGNLAIYTKVIDTEQILRNLSMVQNCPVIFQEAAMQEFDIRATVIGTAVFAVKIGHSEDLGAGARNLDWRHQRLKRTYEQYKLPEDVERMCVELTKTLGLAMGAIDLCFSKEKGYVYKRSY